MKRIAGIWRRDDGIGIATALSVSLIIFVLGATWYSLSVHELDEVASDRHRTGAVNMAEAGVREMMHIIATDQTARDSAKASAFTSGVSGSACDLEPVTSREGATDVMVGEYWARVTKVNPGDDEDRRYVIESWGWAPDHAHRQSDVKKVTLEIELVPFGGGFYYALFAGQYGLAGSNSKTIYGDIYSGADLTIANSTTVLPNDPGWDGNGDVLVHGNLYISGGSNNEFAGTVRVNGFVRDQKKFTDYKGDVVLLHDDPTGSFPLANSTFNSPTVAGSLSAPVTPDGITVGSGKGKVHELIVPASAIDPVPPIALPSFTWNASDYDNPRVWTGATASSDFLAWVASHSADLGAVYDAHLIQGDVALDLSGVKLVDDVVVVAQGDINFSGSPSAADLTGDPLTLTLVVDDSSKTLSLDGQLKMSDADKVHVLAYSKGDISAANLTKIYGAVYSDSDVTGNQLEIHFRPPSKAAIEGFEFDPSLADLFIPQPGVWRETPTDFPVALATYCTP